MPSACLFCGTSGPGALTKEHVVPRWLIEYLQLPPDDLMFQGVADSETGEIKKQRIHSSHNFVEGRICGDCNNGWMSRLESGAKPILIPLMDDQQSVNTLSANERAVLAKWTAKTAYLHSWVGPLQDAVQHDHLNALYGDTGMPIADVGIFAAQTDFAKPNSYIQTGQWPQLGHNLPSDEPAPGSYKIGLQFRRLNLVTAFWPTPNSHLVLTPHHFPVWPIKPEWPAYDGWIPTDEKLDPLGRLLAELAVVQL
jgi:hypothetical protein